MHAQAARHELALRRHGGAVDFGFDLGEWGNALNKMMWAWGVSAVHGEGAYVTLEGAAAVARTGMELIKDGYSMGGTIGALTVGTGTVVLGTGTVMGGVGLGVPSAPTTSTAA